MVDYHQHGRQASTALAACARRIQSLGNQDASENWARSLVGSPECLASTIPPSAQREPVFALKSEVGISAKTYRPHPVRELLGHGSVYTVALAVQLSSSILALPLVTRLLPPAEYGVVALSLLLFLLVGAVCTGGLATVLTRTYFADQEGPAKSRQLILSGTLLAAGVVVVAELAAPLWLRALGNVKNELALHVAVWMAVPGALTGLCEGYFRAAERPVAFVALAIVAAVGGQVIGIALAAVVPGASATTYVLGLGTGYLLAAGGGVVLIRPWRDGFAARRTLRESLAIGIPLLPHNVAWTVLALGDRAIIQRTDGSTAVARYQVAYTMGALALSLVTSIANAWMPIVYSSDDRRRWRVHSETFVAVQVLAALIASGLAIAGPPLLRILTPSSYHEARLASVVALVAISAFPWAVYGGATQILLWYKKTRSLAWITPLSAVVNVVLVAVLVGPFGLTGAALATLVAYSLLALLTRLAIGSTGSMRSFQRPILLAWTAALVLAVAGVAAPSAGAWLALRALIAGGLAFAFVLVVRTLIAPRASSDPQEPIQPVPLVSGP